MGLSVVAARRDFAVMVFFLERFSGLATTWVFWAG